MKWPDYCGEIKMGEQWDITFVPVHDSVDKVIPSRFVIVLTVKPCAGGVFAQMPESYYVDGNNEVKQMDFEMWSSRMLGKEALKYCVPVLVQRREKWSTPTGQCNYMKLTQQFENLRQQAKWKIIRRMATHLIEHVEKNPHNSNVNDELLSLFQLVAVAYSQGEFNEARKLQLKMRDKTRHAEDTAIFEVEKRYSLAAIERASCNYDEALRVIKEGLSEVERAPCGFVPATFYALAISISSILISRDTAENHMENARKYCGYALQHLEFVSDEFDIAKEELRQRINITLSFLYLRTSIAYGPYTQASFENSNEGHVSPEDLKYVADLVAATEKSLANLEIECKNSLKFNKCRQLIVKSDQHARYAQLTSRPADRRFYLAKSLKFVKKALKKAELNEFEEIKLYCTSREEELNHALHFLKDIEPSEAGENEEANAIIDSIINSAT